MRDYALDMADVRGLPLARRALEIAAAGGHNVLLIGPPGSGKSMLARRLLGILPELDPQTVDEVGRIRQLANLDRAARPFRSPHYTVSVPGMVGQFFNAHWLPHPGELALAHGGVLCLDDLPEFSLAVLRAIEAALDSDTVDLWTARRTASLPARFQVVATMTACPCGYSGHPTRACTCPPASVLRWWERVKHLGRHFPIVVDLSRDSDHVTSGPSTATIRERVQGARRMLDREASPGWSVAQTIAALAGSMVGTGEHLREEFALYNGCAQLREARTT